MPTSTSSLFTLGRVDFDHEVKVVKENGLTKEIERNNYNILLTTNPDVIQKSYLNNTFLEQGGSINDGNFRFC